MAKLKKADISRLLAVVAAAMANPPQFSYLTVAAAKPLADAGLVEMNTTMANPAKADEFASRPTAAGIEEAKKHQAPAAGSQPQPGATSAATPAASAFKVVTGVARPTVKRGGGGGNVYPFDTMAAPVPGLNGPQEASFFVPSTADKPNPAKSLASTVSSATKRYADQNPARKFVVRSIADGAAWGDEYKGVKGAGVFRTL